MVPPCGLLLCGGLAQVAPGQPFSISQDSGRAVAAAQNEAGLDVLVSPDFVDQVVRPAEQEAPPDMGFSTATLTGCTTCLM